MESEGLAKVVEVMLVPEDFLINDTDTNYVRLIQEWEMNKMGAFPGTNIKKHLTHRLGI